MAECLAGPGEPLADHLLGVARCVAKRGTAVAKKLSRQFKIGESEAMDMLVFAALAHDVGKADAKYRGATEYFPHHQVKSTAFVKRVFQELGLLIDCDMGGSAADLAKAVLAAVALHHYAHKDPKKAPPAEELAPMCPEVAEAFKQWEPLSPLGKALRAKAIDVSISYVPRTTCYNDVIRTLPNIGIRLRYAIMAILGVLNKCDYEVAKSMRLS
ncbi:CRISPR-associated endonuclease Cas3'' [Pyrobaculum aerophilum]|uniref:CRISPR-associated endonuclease Cas3'' n=1 Tax=Pyrobaculum aerophilum TaxID=13773 RepID=UPI0023F25683|nr:CRISPR-associated endonuclease Cas3'' [Pyrobaculum aerophilum]MCX8136983.1 HD domain-containing protein [Pyrobaculum aerophilum]